MAERRSPSRASPARLGAAEPVGPGAAEAAIPREIGPYAVVETVAARAFTVTYRAEQRALGRTVLVRTLKASVSPDSPFAAELEREARILGKLDHDGIVRVHDLVRGPGALYLVLEDPRAVPLDEVIRARPPDPLRLEPEVAAAVALSVARALGHAHERGVVHRALSASGVAIAARGRVVLTDLSAADMADLPSLPEPASAGEALGQADHLSPEQILGERAVPASDVFALGVLLHRLLAGAHPFQAGDARGLAFSASRIRAGAPASLPPSVPEALARVVARCLSKDTDDRYPDGRALAVALGEALGALSRAPVPVLVSRALAAAGLGEALPAGETAPRDGRAPAAPVDVPRAARRLAVVLALIVAGGLGQRLLDDPDAAEGEGVPESGVPGATSRDHGALRVVARPWAEVYVDGELVDVTPIGRPIPVPPGRHFVTFRHPSAPDEQRSIKIAAGQSVFLDVTMRIDRGDAGPARAAPSAESP